MSILPDFSRQYQPPKIPTHWSADERRFAQGVTDVLDDIYLRYGRLNKKDLSPALSREITDASGNILLINANAEALSARMANAEGDVSSLSLRADAFDAFVADADGNYARFNLAAKRAEWLVSGGEGTSAIVLTPGAINAISQNVNIEADRLTLAAKQALSLQARSDLVLGARNYVLDSRALFVSGLGSAAGSIAEYRFVNLGQSYMGLAAGTEITISFDLEMQVNTANPTLQVYNDNNKGPKMVASRMLTFTAAVGSTIRQRCAVSTVLSDRADANMPDNYLEFYSTYGTSNWFKVSFLQVETGNKASDWQPAPEDIEGRMDAAEIALAPDKLSLSVRSSQPYIDDLAGKGSAADVSTLKAWKNTAEFALTKDAITASVRNHADYKSDLGNKNKVYWDTSAPSGANTGDLWMDTSLSGGVPKNLPHRWTGSAWVPAPDVNISLAQQKADRIDWVVASGTSSSNMTLTNELYSLMAANINLSANNSIKLAVGGGTNLIKNSGQFSDASGWAITDGSGNETISVGSNASLNSTILTLGNLSVNYNLRSPASKSPIVTGQTYTLSFVFSGNIPSSASVYNSATNTALSPSLTFPTREQFAGSFYLYKSTFIATSGADDIRVRISVPYQDATDYLGWIKLEKGTQATDWSPAPSDPASGVKTSKVTIDTNGVAIATGGVFTVSSSNFGIDASGNVTVKGTIIATSGTIGGLTIRSDALSIGKTSASDPSAGMWLDSTGLSLGDLRISQSGYFYKNDFTFRAPNNGDNVTLSLETNVLGTGTSYGGMNYGFHDYSASMNMIDGTVSMKVPNVTAGKIFVTYRYYTTNQSTRMIVSSDLYCDYNCSALSFTDRTPAYTGNALDELRWVRGNRAQGIDHNSIPPFARKTIKNTRTLPDGTVEHYHEPGRDLGAMISILTKAVQEIDDRMNAFERRLPA